jgi:hypothetical protein
MLSHPPYSPDEVPGDSFISKLKSFDEREDIRGCFSYPTDCDEKTEGEMGKNMLSYIRYVV